MSAVIVVLVCTLVLVLSVCVVLLLCFFSFIFFFFFCSYSILVFFFFFSSRRRHTRCLSDWSSDVCSSDLLAPVREQVKHARIDWSARALRHVVHRVSDQQPGAGLAARLVAQQLVAHGFAPLGSCARVTAGMTSRVKSSSDVRAASRGTPAAEIRQMR